MKKSKLKSLVKSARKTARKDIRISLVTELKEIAGKFGQGSKKLTRDIEKGSKQLAKKIAKDIKIDTASLTEAPVETVAAPVIVTEKKAVASKKTKSKTAKVEANLSETEEAK